ncbi:MAG: site-2 protease family protein [Candidatus Nealsonbacteria bacterium DGGOD1a]|nr:MAG: site-2 protease family protein [Candidatus Nealsonbacteria bacterium DGGOD1a]
MAEILILIFSIIALIFSVVIHEVAHGAVANSLGDPTAKYAGRLTLNPLKHFDWVGSFFLPLLLTLLRSPFIFGWAKPVPINPYNFRDQKYGQVKVAVAGVAANFALAAIFGLILRFWPVILDPVSAGFYTLAQSVVIINLGLAVFNLIPIPPLDGSHILFAFLPPSQTDFKIFLQKYGPVFLLVFIFFFLPVIWPIIAFLYQIITGVALE